MPWATVFLPHHIRQLMNLETSLELKRASGFNISSDEVNFLKAISLRSVFFRRGGLMFLPAHRHASERAGILRRNCEGILRYLLFLVPYLDRPRFRPSTPRASR